MTIRFLRDYQGYSSGSEISTLSTRQEDLAIAAGAATRTLGAQQAIALPVANMGGGKPDDFARVVNGSLVSGDGTVLFNAGSIPERVVGDELSQPATITSAVTAFGKLAARFGTGQWTATAGSPTLTQGYTGWDGSGTKTGIVSRTGQPDMLKVVPAANTTEQLTLGSFATNMLTKSLNGKFGLWVYVEAQPGYATGSAGAGAIAVEVGTNAGQTNPLFVSFNSNQIREGWNFLTFVMRNPAAYVDGNPDVEYHPFGVSASNFGTGANSNILASPAAYIKVQWDNMLGASLYFDSIWTDFTSKPQVVIGCDQGPGLEEFGVPVMDAYGWVGYLAAPFRIWSSGSYQVTDMDGADATIVAQQTRLYAKGWDIVNHTINHLANGTLTSEAALLYEVQMAQAWQYEANLWRGAEFYASPQSSSSRLSEKVIKGAGFKLQRHARKWNVTPTPFGIDNPHHVGALDISSAGAGVLAYNLVTGGTASSVTGLQQASKLQRVVDVAIAYGATIFPFWHGITITGDTGSGEDLTGDSLLMTRSAFLSFISYIRAKEQAGELTVCRGISGFYYGA